MSHPYQRSHRPVATRSKGRIIAERIAGVFGIAAIGIIGTVVIAAILAFFFALGTAIRALIVALVWNVLNVHELFNAEPLAFWHVVGVAVLWGILSSIFGARVSYVREAS